MTSLSGPALPWAFKNSSCVRIKGDIIDVDDVTDAEEYTAVANRFKEYPLTLGTLRAAEQHKHEKL